MKKILPIALLFILSLSRTGQSQDTSLIVPPGCTKLPSGIVLCPKKESLKLMSEEKKVEKDPRTRLGYIQYDPWTYLGSSTSQHLYIRDVKHRSAWLKWVPKKTAPRSKLMPSTAAYRVQFATADCETERLSVESTRFYNSHDVLVPSRRVAAYSMLYEPQYPGTIGAGIVKLLCNSGF